LKTFKKKLSILGWDIKEIEFFSTLGRLAFGEIKAYSVGGEVTVQSLTFRDGEAKEARS